MQGGCTCENADYCASDPARRDRVALGAAALGMTTADDWTKTLPETAFPAMQRALDHAPAPKDNGARLSDAAVPNTTTTSRSAMYAWMNTQLKLGLPEPSSKRIQTADTGRGDGLDERASGAATGEAEERRVTAWWTEASNAR